MEAEDLHDVHEAIYYYLKLDCDKLEMHIVNAKVVTPQQNKTKRQSYKPSARCPPLLGWRGIDNCVFWRTEKRIPLHRRERALSFHAGHPCRHRIAPGRAVLPRIMTATASGSARGTKGYLGHNLGGGGYHPHFTDEETDLRRRKWLPPEWERGKAGIWAWVPVSPKAVQSDEVPPRRGRGQTCLAVLEPDEDWPGAPSLSLRRFSRLQVGEGEPMSSRTWRPREAWAAVRRWLLPLGIARLAVLGWNSGSQDDTAVKFPRKNLS